MIYLHQTAILNKAIQIFSITIKSIKNCHGSLLGHFLMMVMGPSVD